MAPGALLAMVLGAVAGDGGEGLAGMADDQLVGFLSGTRRMESHLARPRMAALAEFASRPRRQDFAAAEVAAAFHLTWLSAAGQIGYAQAVAKRLPVTYRAGRCPAWKCWPRCSTSRTGPVPCATPGSPGPGRS